MEVKIDYEAELERLKNCCKNQQYKIKELEEQLDNYKRYSEQDYKEYQNQRTFYEQRIAYLTGIINGMAASLQIDFKELIYDNYNEAR